MLKQKKDNFVPEVDGEEFPEFTSLGNAEVILHQRNLRTAFNGSQNMDILKVFKKMVERSVSIPNINGKEDNIDFTALLLSKGIHSKKDVYIDWHRFDEIDRIELSSFTKYFDDIWYPEADDIYVYDDTFNWFVLVTHYGAISITKAEKNVK